MVVSDTIVATSYHAYQTCIEVLVGTWVANQPQTKCCADVALLANTRKKRCHRL